MRWTEADLARVRGEALPEKRWRSKGGRRADLGGRFFRSAWEANYARYLRWLVERGVIKGWEYEPRTFVFEGVRRGVLTYTPDFLVTEHDGRQEWHEVKGWMDRISKAKLKRMHQFYPGERIRVIGAPEMRAIAAAAAGLVAGWESGDDSRGRRG